MPPRVRIFTPVGDLVATDRPFVQVQPLMDGNLNDEAEDCVSGDEFVNSSLVTIIRVGLLHLSVKSASELKWTLMEGDIATLYCCGLAKLLCGDGPMSPVKANLLKHWVSNFCIETFRLI